jgi:phage terminase small subunit
MAKSKKTPAPKKDKELQPRFGNSEILANTLIDFDALAPSLNIQQRIFCLEYIRNGFNGLQAAIAAGYSPNGAGTRANNLLQVPEIQKLIASLKNEISHRVGISAIDIAREYKRIGFSDVRQIFDEQGNLIRIKDIGPDSASSIQSIEIYEEFAGNGEDRKMIGYTKKIKFHNKIDALDKLAKMIGADVQKKDNPSTPQNTPFVIEVVHKTKD